jgi:hypothetical protein
MDGDRTHDFGLRGPGLDSHPGPEWHFRKHSHLSTTDIKLSGLYNLEKDNIIIITFGGTKLRRVAKLLVMSTTFCVERINSICNLTTTPKTS